MVRRRFSIAGLMALVVCAAVNFAAIRLLLGVTREFLAGLALIVPVLQVGMWRVIREHGRSCAFWVGFVAGGLAATIVFVWAMFDPPLNSTPGAYVVEGQGRGSQLWRLWDHYVSFVMNAVVALLAQFHIAPNSSMLVTLFAIVVWSLPQLATAFVAGAIARMLCTNWQKASDEVVAPAS